MSKVGVMKVNRKRLTVMTVTIVAVVIVIVVACTYGRDVTGKRKFQGNGKDEKEEENIIQYKWILKQMKADRIEENLRYLSEFPRNPAGERNREIVKNIAEKWRRSGFDKTEVFPYNFYLSFPESPGEISLLKDGVLKKKLVIGNEPPVDETETKGDALYPFNAYSPKGEVTAEYVYGNYGLESDFETLKEIGVDVVGKIMILRYGKTFRGNKVRSAEVRGAVGVILYTDPGDYATYGTEYPPESALSKNAVQRGTITRLQGDPLSIGYPAKSNYFRINETKYSGNPKILSQPISYSSAYELLTFMRDDSKDLPSDFQGGLNLTYVLQSGKGRTLTLKVNTKLETREALTVCTTIYGKDEPDRYLMLGGHRDSWVYGAQDNGGGTAAIMEIVNILGKIKKKTKWRPRRSIMACSWGAEEHGMMGSTEWADENHKFITEHVVAYLNADGIVTGNFTLSVSAFEIMRDSIYEAAKFTQAPDTPNKSLYEDWYAKSIILAQAKNKTFSKPSLGDIYGYSDHRAFMYTYGTTVVNFGYTYSKKDFPGVSPYGIYHTLYDSFGWVKKYLDPNFVYHLGIARFMAAYSLLIADSQILPLNLFAYTKQIKYHLTDFEKAYVSMLTTRQISLTFAHQRLDALIEKTKQFHNYVDKIDKERTSAYEFRSINDKLMNFERNFLLTGISKDSTARHVVYAGTINKMKSTKFPGISEAVYFASKNAKDDWDEVRKQITLVIWCFDTANKSLDFDEWRH